MPFVKLRHTVHGGEWDCPDDPDVLKDWATRGWVVAGDETDPEDPKYGTYDGDDHQPDPEQDEPEQDAEPTTEQPDQQAVEATTEKE
jgi:hypothetical protein